MADHDLATTVRIAACVSEIPSECWDSIAGDDPFLSHAFLSALERSGSVGRGTGWRPSPLIIEATEARLRAAAPAYLKEHSQGEYVFDHTWADAYERAGGQYYPKLQVAVPFSPVPGRRLLGDQPELLVTALETIVLRNELSSAHATFIAPEEKLAFEQRGWLIREGLQFHWFNRGFNNFDDFLDRLTSRKRKMIRKERAQACHGLDFVALRGTDIEPHHWDAMWSFYQDTGRRKWGRPYLARSFFDLLGETLGDRCLLFLAMRGDDPIAGALNLVGTDTLYGRYWGAKHDRPFLHFELSYYRAMEWAIAHGLSCLQAGAQGEHKLKRGYEPISTWSAHFIPNPSFRRAVKSYLDREREIIAAEKLLCSAAMPYRSSA